MNKIVVTIGTAMFLFIGGSSLTSCGNSGETTAAPEAKVEEAHAHKHYQCPMDCEEGKVYEVEGTCPVCKMELKEVEA